MAEEAVHIKLLKSSAAPVNYVLDKYSSLAIAQYFSLVGLIATVMAATFALWAVVKMTDPQVTSLFLCEPSGHFVVTPIHSPCQLQPYLYNNGKLGPLEAKSVFVCSETGNHVAPKQCASGPDGCVPLWACKDHPQTNVFAANRQFM